MKIEYKGGNYFKGTYNDYKYSAKVYEDASKYGIDRGKVSKLSIRDVEGSEVVNYDRGWDVKPTKEHNGAYMDILKYLEDLDVSKY